ncbi:hypothetical protein GCM10020000_35400 [Streptomyces olivoverticillatus]
MRLPRTAHTDRPWRIHEIAGDFTVEDVWALPTPGGPDDLVWLVRQTAEGISGGVNGEGPVSRALFAVRWKLGALLGWDKPDTGTGTGTRLPSLRDRLPSGPWRGPPRAPTSDRPPSLPSIRQTTSGPPRWAIRPCTR